MHPYGIDTHQRRNLTIWLIVISFLVAPLVRNALTQLGWDTPTILEYALDVTSAGGVFYILIEQTESTLWKNSLFRKLFRVTVPDLNGHWTGVLKSSFNDFTVEYPITLDIVQEWSEISIELNRPKGSGSTSNTASIFLRAGARPKITYTYENKPDADQVETMHAHDGTAFLDVYSNSVADRLVGGYYTGRDRKTFGTMELTKVPS